MEVAPRDKRDNPDRRSRYRRDKRPPLCRSHASGTETSIGGAARSARSVTRAGRSRPRDRLSSRHARVARYDCRLGRRDHAIESLRLIQLCGPGARISAMARIAARTSVRLDAPRRSARRGRNFNGRSAASEHDGRCRGYDGSAELCLAFGVPGGRIPIGSDRPLDRRRTTHRRDGIARRTAMRVRAGHARTRPHLRRSVGGGDPVRRASEPSRHSRSRS